MAVVVSRDGEWRCMQYGQTLSRIDQEAGCGDHRYLPDLVAGEQVDFQPDRIIYRMADGSQWVDDGPYMYAPGDVIDRHVCRSCGSFSWTVTEGKGPHAAGLRCTGCNANGGWLPKAEVAV